MTQDTDNSEPSKAELYRLIKQQQQQIDDLKQRQEQSALDLPVGRRGVIGALAAALGLGAAGSVSAGSDNVGTVGDESASELVDVEAEDVECEKLNLEGLSSAPSTVNEGDIYFLPSEL
jgi:ferric-dicitrate binding protein FerR (iron transport regulator)